MRRAKQAKLDLRVRVSDWAREVEACAHAITTALESLPANTSRGSQGLLEDQGRRLLAVAAGMKTEIRNPDPTSVKMWQRIGSYTLATTLTVGGLVFVGTAEEAGSDAWHVLRDRIEAAQDAVADRNEREAQDRGDRVQQLASDIEKLRLNLKRAQKRLHQFNWEIDRQTGKVRVDTSSSDAIARQDKVQLELAAAQHEVDSLKAQLRQAQERVGELLGFEVPTDSLPHVEVRHG